MLETPTPTTRREDRQNMSAKRRRKGRRRPHRAGASHSIPEPQPDPPSDRPRPRTAFQQRIQKVCDATLFRIAPLRWGLRHVEKERAFHEERDAKSFKAASLPDGEVVDLRCIWAMEVFLPSH